MTKKVERRRKGGTAKGGITNASDEIQTLRGSGTRRDRTFHPESHALYKNGGEDIVGICPHTGENRLKASYGQSVDNSVVVVGIAQGFCPSQQSLVSAAFGMGPQSTIDNVFSIFYGSGSKRNVLKVAPAISGNNDLESADEIVLLMATIYVLLDLHRYSETLRCSTVVIVTGYLNLGERMTTDIWRWVDSGFKRGSCRNFAGSRLAGWYKSLQKLLIHFEERLGIQVLFWLASEGGEESHWQVIKGTCKLVNDYVAKEIGPLQQEVRDYGRQVPVLSFGL